MEPTEENSRKKLSICFISDTHGNHRQLVLPNANRVDVLIHAGDFTSYGRGVKDFDDWLGSLQYTTKIVVLGNHDCHIENIQSLIKNATLLRDESITLNGGFMIHGTKFYWPGELYQDYRLVPPGTDILISHQPMKGYFDGGGGCPALLKRVKQIKPKVVVSGHVHAAYGHSQGKIEDGLHNTFIINASLCGPEGKERRLFNDPVVFQIEK